MRSCCILVALSPALLAIPAIAAADLSGTATTPVQSIEIRCTESSLAGPQHAELRIVRQGDTFFDGARRLDVLLVIELASALDGPVAALEIAAVLPPPNELLRAGQRYADSITLRPAAKASLRKRLLAALADPARVAATLESRYASSWTDDYPECQFSLVFDSGRRLSGRSKSQQAFMLPWQLADAESWSPRIGRALAALLPPGFLQRERLAGVHFADTLAQLIAAELLR